MKSAETYQVNSDLIHSPWSQRQRRKKKRGEEKRRYWIDLNILHGVGSGRGTWRGAGVEMWWRRGRGNKVFEINARSARYEMKKWDAT